MDMGSNENSGHKAAAGACSALNLNVSEMTCTCSINRNQHPNFAHTHTGTSDGAARRGAIREIHTGTDTNGQRVSVTRVHVTVMLGDWSGGSTVAARPLPLPGCPAGLG